MEVVNLPQYPVPQVTSYLDTTFGKLVVEDERMDQYAQVRVLFNNIGSMEEKYGKLLQYRTALEEAKMLTPHIALECDAVMEDGVVLKTCFCDEEEQKKYDIAMEAISGGLALLIAAIAAALGSLIVHLIAHYKGQAVENGLKSGTSTNTFKEWSATAGVLECAEISGEVAQALNEEMQAGSTGKASTKELKVNPRGKRNQVATEDSTSYKYSTDTTGWEVPKTHPEHQGEAVKPQNAPGYIRPLTSLQRDHLTRGEYSKIMVQTLKEVDDAHPAKVLADTREAYKTMLLAGHRDEAAAREADPTKQQQYLDGLAQQFERLMDSPRKVYQLCAESLQRLSAKAVELNRGAPAVPEEFHQALRVFAQAVQAREILYYAHTREALIPELEKLRAEIAESQTFYSQTQKEHDEGKSTGFDANLAKHGKKVLTDIRNLIGALMQIDMQFQQYWKSLNAAAHYLYFVASQARLKFALALIEDGVDRKEVKDDFAIRQLDHILGMLESYRQKSS